MQKNQVPLNLSYARLIRDPCCDTGLGVAPLWHKRTVFAVWKAFPGTCSVKVKDLKSDTEEAAIDSRRRVAQTAFLIYNTLEHRQA